MSIKPGHCSNYYHFRKSKLNCKLPSRTRSCLRVGHRCFSAFSSPTPERSLRTAAHPGVSLSSLFARPSILNRKHVGALPLSRAAILFHHAPICLMEIASVLLLACIHRILWKKVSVMLAEESPVCHSDRQISSWFITLRDVWL